MTEPATTVQRNPLFKQVCVWPGTLITPDEVADFECFVLRDLGARIQFLETILTYPDVNAHGEQIKGTGGRSDVFFAVHDDDALKFSAVRLGYGMRWIEDAIAIVNGGNRLYPARVIEYVTWNEGAVSAGPVTKAQDDTDDSWNDAQDDG